MHFIVDNDNPITPFLTHTNLNGVDETTRSQILHRYPLLSNSSTKCYSVVTKFGLVTMFIIGSGAGILYWAPSLTCAQSGYGHFLSNLITENGAHAVYFVSGFLGFGGSNAFFSTASLPHLIQYIREQRTIFNKFWKSIAIIALSFTQTISIFIAATTTGSNLLLTMLTASGSFPGALFTSVNLMEKDIPHIFSKIKEGRIKILLHLEKLCGGYCSLVEQHQKEKLEYYRKGYDQFIKKLEIHWKSMINKSNEIVFTGIEDLKEDYNKPLILLFDENINENSSLLLINPDTPPVIKIINHTISFLATMFTLNFTAAIVNNTFDGLESESYSNASRWILSGIFNLSTIYNNFVVTNGGIISIYEVIKKLLLGRNPLENSLNFKLYPKLSTGIAFLSLALGSWSIAIIDTMTKEMIDNRGIPQAYAGTIRITADVGIAAYHIFALYKLYLILLKKFTPNLQNHILFMIEEEVRKYKAMSVPVFTERITNLNANTREKWGLETFEERKAIGKKEAYSYVNLKTKNYGAEEYDTHSSINKSSGLRSWFSCIFCCVKRVPKRKIISEAHVVNFSNSTTA
jgi:hypothetical protein